MGCLNTRVYGVIYICSYKYRRDKQNRGFHPFLRHKGNFKRRIRDKWGHWGHTKRTESHVTQSTLYYMDSTTRKHLYFNLRGNPSGSIPGSLFPTLL